MAGLAIAGTVAQHQAQASAGKAQGKYQNSVYKQNAQAALESYMRASGQLQGRAMQEVEAATRDATDIQRTGDAAAGQVKTNAAARGVSGLSVQDMLTNYAAVTTDNEFAVKRQLGWTRHQIAEEMEGLAGTTRSRIASATPGPVDMPSGLATGINIASAGLGAYREYRKNQPPTTNSKAP
jgi:hypothetical protein